MYDRNLENILFNLKPALFAILKGLEFSGGASYYIYFYLV